MTISARFCLLVAYGPAAATRTLFAGAAGPPAPRRPARPNKRRQRRSFRRHTRPTATIFHMFRARCFAAAAAVQIRHKFTIGRIRAAPRDANWTCSPLALRVALQGGGAAARNPPDQLTERSTSSEERKSACEQIGEAIKTRLAISRAGNELGRRPLLNPSQGRRRREIICAT